MATMVLTVYLCYTYGAPYRLTEMRAWVSKHILSVLSDVFITYPCHNIHAD